MMRSPLYCGHLAEFIKSEGSDLTDAVIISRDENRFPVHRVLLASGSDFFKRLFLFNENSSNDVANEFKIIGSSGDELKAIIRWFYTDELLITEENVYDLLEAAEFLCVPAVSQICQGWLISRITRDSALGLWRYAEEHLLQEFGANILEYLLEHLEHVLEMEEFLELEEEAVEKVLSDERVACGEDVVWKAVVRWWEHDRTRTNGNIFNVIRIHLLDPYFYHEKMSPYFAVNREPRCPLSFKTSVENHLSILYKSKEKKRKNSAFLRGPGSFLFIFGWEEEHIGFDYGMRLYNPQCGSWRQLSIELPFGWAGKNLVQSRTQVYIPGSSLVQMPENKLTQAFFKLDLRTMTLTKLENLPKFKDRASLAILGDKLYVLGGLKKPWITNPYDAHRSVEVYNCKEDTWSEAPFMIEKRSDASTAFTKESIFMLGGYNGRKKALASCEEFYLQRWRQLPSMASPRAEAGSVALDGRVYVVGGKKDKFDRNGLKSGEVLDRQRERWKPLPDMNIPRYNHSLVIMDGKIRAIGGNINNVQVTDSVEVLEEDRWVEVGKLPIGLSQLSSVVVSARELDTETIPKLFSPDKDDFMTRKV